MYTLRGSVGNKGKNQKEDVRLVQNLLNANIASLLPLRAVDADGKIGPLTIELLEAFQRRVIKMQTPDGMVLPHSATFRALLLALGTYPTGALASPPWLKVAADEEGETEQSGLAHNNSRILEYIGTFPYLSKVPYMKKKVDTGYKMGDVDETAWCACFVNWCLKEAGKSGGPAATAKSWLNYGVPSGPKLGAVTIIYRKPFNDSASGWHIGFWIGGSPSVPALLGGNQNNSVCRKQFLGVEKIFYRWPL